MTLENKLPDLPITAFFHLNPISRLDFGQSICYLASPIAKLWLREPYFFCLWRRADAGINQTKGT